MPIRKSIDQLFSSTVWKITFAQHGSAPAMALELRPAEARLATWAVVDLLDNQLLWQSIAPVEPQPDAWFSLVGLYPDTLLLHRHATDSPQPLGLLALDRQTGKQRYELPGLVFLQTDGRVLATTAGPNTPILLFNLTTGEPTPLALGSTEENRFEVLFPHYYAASNAYFPPVARFVKKHTGQEAVQAVHYLESETRLLVSYYIYAGNLLENWLLVVKNKTRIELNERISAGVGLNPDPFAVYAEHLIFVQNLHCLVGYALT